MEDCARNTTVNNAFHHNSRSEQISRWNIREYMNTFSEYDIKSDISTQLKCFESPRIRYPNMSGCLVFMVQELTVS